MVVKPSSLCKRPQTDCSAVVRTKNIFIYTCMAAGAKPNEGHLTRLFSQEFRDFENDRPSALKKGIMNMMILHNRVIRLPNHFGCQSSCIHRPAMPHTEGLNSFQGYCG